MIDGVCGGGGWACAWLWDTVLCDADSCLSSHYGPFLEKFQAIFEALVAHTLLSVSCQCQLRKIGTFGRVQSKRGFAER